MALYIYWPNSEEYNYLLSNRDERNRILRQSGKPIEGPWRPPSVAIGGGELPFSDFPLLWTSTPIFSERALNVLKPMLGDSIQALPFPINGSTRYYLVNVLDVIDCLDRTQPVIVPNPASTQVAAVTHYVFKPQLIAGRHLFKIPETCGIEVFVSSEFREMAEASGLTGLRYGVVH